MTMDPEFIAVLQTAFKEEANEHLQNISVNLLSIDKEPESTAESVEKLLRIFHSLKGSSRAVNLGKVEKCCQLIESILIKHKQSRVPDTTMAILNTARIMFQRTVDELGQEGFKEDLDDLLSALKELEGEKVVTTPLTTEAPRDEAPEEDSTEMRAPRGKASGAGSIRLPVEQLENYVKLSEELVYAKLASEQRISELSEIQSVLNQWSRRWQRLRPEVENITQTDVGRNGGNGGNSGNSRRLTDLREFVDMHDSFVAKMLETLNSIEKSVVADERTIHNLVDSLLDRGRELTMVPFEIMNNLLSRIVWDIGKQQNKQVELDISGADVQIDRNILDELKDPIIHLIRNCIDHGIETAEERAAGGKIPTATVSISLEPVGSGKVKIEVRDDGRGIDVEKVKKSALEKRLIRKELLENFSEEQILSLLFRSSFSTKDEVSAISGRGLGLTIVKENVERLNGTVTISSVPGQETKFTIMVPVRRATMVGITARIGNQTMVVPTIAINSAVRLQDQDVRMLQGKWTLNYNDRLLPIIRLADILQIESKLSLEESIALIVGTSEYPIALTVEEVSGEQEVAVKNLPAPLTRVRNIAGATQLKTGDLAVVINMKDVLTSPYLVGALTGEAPLDLKPLKKSTSEREERSRKRILVVEDSITSRVLLKNILESAGYEVLVAADGSDGFDKYRQTEFDLVVTDVEMPRMNGFELTAKIRHESERPNVPIIVVTSLASLEDRKRGVEVGASAYFVKSNFEKSNLLDMVERLI
ncbi:MAG: response regulator [Cyanobacteriota/Melainabacteria group bacterium]